ncbi:hypothetical protein HA466_0023810 [Hirschfeldia incana]|nr:hypothetical protein HA466_0023810 [Hirschfeldia incana]
MDRIKPEFMKKLTKFIVISIWVSTLLITHNFYLCKLTIQLVTHAVDKTYVFVICNGLLVFVAKYSGLIASSKPVEEIWNNRGLDSYNAMLEPEYYSVHERESFLDEEVSIEDQETEEEKEDENEEDEDEEESDEPLPENGDLEEECDIHGGFREEEDNVEMVTEEDVNKKFEEFIRKMKEELRLEAKQQLILV